MKLILTFMTLLFSLSLFAHEGGHGVVTEGGKFGGIMSPVVAFAEQGKGDKATTLYKAELVRSESGTLSLYLFDLKLNVLPLKDFSEVIESKLEIKKKGKFIYFGTFQFKKNGNHYTAQLPKVEYKPFNIDLFFNKGSDKFFVGFSNLD